MKKSWVILSIVTATNSYLTSLYASEGLDAMPEIIRTQKSSKSSLGSVLSSGDKIDILQLASDNITGTGKEEFLRCLGEASSNKQDSLKAFTKVIDGIQMGFIDNQKVAYKDAGKAGKLVYNLAKQIAKLRYDSLSERNLPSDETFQRAIQELSSCYNLGIGVESNEETVKLLSEYIPNGEDVE